MIARNGAVKFYFSGFFSKKILQNHFRLLVKIFKRYIVYEVEDTPPSSHPRSFSTILASSAYTNNNKEWAHGNFYLTAARVALLYSHAPRVLHLCGLCGFVPEPDLIECNLLLPLIFVSARDLLLFVYIFDGEKFFWMQYRIPESM